MAKKKQKILYLLISLSALVFLFFAYTELNNYFWPEDEIPKALEVMTEMEERGVSDFSLPDSKGESFKLSSLRGKIIVINFWASWCSPCVEEMPDLIRLAKRYKGKLELVTISYDDSWDEIHNFFKSLDTSNLYSLKDNNFKVAHLYGLSDQKGEGLALPVSFVVGYDFKLVRKVIGFEKWNTPEAINFFDSLVKN